MEKIIDDYLDPMFSFIDCDGDGVITAENIWQSLRLLKRPDTKYNIYDCVIDSNQIRTTSVNDFILKSERTMLGKINRDEWRMGILQGYWIRQVDKSGVFVDDAKNMKNIRWDDNGKKDSKCEEMKENLKNGA